MKYLTYSLLLTVFLACISCNEDHTFEGLSFDLNFENRVDSVARTVEKAGIDSLTIDLVWTVEAPGKADEETIERSVVPDEPTTVITPKVKTLADGKATLKELRVIRILDHAGREKLLQTEVIQH